MVYAPLSRPARGAARAALWPAAALYLFVGAFPGWRVPGSDVLDGAWVVEVNRLAAGAFGRDVTFTYGPLGFLLYPAGTTSHVVLALACRVAVLAGLAAWVLWKGSAADRALFVLAQVAAAGLGLTFEYQLLVPAILLAVGTLEPSRAATATLAALAVVAGAAFFAKFSTGVALTAIVGGAALVKVGRERAGALPAVGLAALAALATVAVVAAATLAHPADLLPWARRSAELASGYSEAMSLDSQAPARAATAVGAAALLAGLFGLGLVGAWRGSAAGRLALLSSLPAFLAFKHAFVRQDVYHTTLYFPFLLAVCSGAALLASSRVERRWCRAGVALTAGLSLWVAASYAQPAGVSERVASSLQALSGHDGAAALAGWARIEERRTEILERLAPSSPPGLATALAGRALGIVPFSLAFCASPGVTCTPNPTLQTFAAYTSGLDEWSGEHYLGERAPPFVLLHPDGIDGRIPAFDHPALWRALVAAYQVADVQPGGGLLLARRAAVERPRLVEVARASAGAEQWVEVPDVPGPLYASVALDPTWLGRARRAAFRVEPVVLALEYPDGLQVSFRLVPDTARDGLPMDQLPLFPQDLLAAFSGGLARRPARLALLGPGLASYAQPITVSWLAKDAGAAPHDP
ncbi:MAG TPA: hypothetical protein VFP50_18865 [Anaeromyxobacteraceae bacterium]|nr:hypothetical protein [Anaeromyxobacteraceae bacterium]